MELAPRSSKYDIKRLRTAPDKDTRQIDTADEQRWIAEQTKTPPPAPHVPPPPVREVWPDTTVAAYCRDVGRMTLDEFNWCLAKNHWDADLHHIPYGAPTPPVLEPVWWWPGWGSRWGKLTEARNPHGYVDNWFARGKARAREPFKHYFGTLESEMAREFAAAIETLTLEQAVRRQEGRLRSEVAEAAARLGPTFVPPKLSQETLSQGSLRQVSLAGESVSLHGRK